MSNPVKKRNIISKEYNDYNDNGHTSKRLKTETNNQENNKYITSSKIKELMKNSNFEELKNIFNISKFYDNEFIKWLLILYKNKTPIKNLNYEISKDKYKIIVDYEKEDNFYNKSNYIIGKGNINLIKYLVEHGVDINKVVYKNGKTILFDACESENKDLVEYLVDSCEIKRKACDVWNDYKNEVFDDTAKFDDFLREVFVGRYHDDACITKLLLEYHMHLAELYMQEASGRLENKNGLGFEEEKSVLSQRAFLVCMAARSTDPSNFDISPKGKKLSNIYMHMFKLSGSMELERSSITIETKKKLEKLRCPFDIGIVAQMSEAYAYARKNCVLLSSYIWFFFYKNKIVCRRNQVI